MLVSKIILAFLVVGVAIVGVDRPAHGSSGDSIVVVLDRDYAFSDPVLDDCPAYEIAADRVMVMMTEPLATRTEVLEAGGTVLSGEAPLWVTPAAIPEDTARATDIEVLSREGINTVFRASTDAAYGLLARGYFVVRIELRPLHWIKGVPWSRPFVEGMLECRPLDGPRARFLESVTDSVDTLNLRNTLRFLEYDDANERYRSRFQVRPEVRQQVVPYLLDMLDTYVSPYGGHAAEQQFVQKLGGAFACTDTIPCDTIFTNVIGHKPGSRTSAHYIICAHYDAIATRTPGWSDQWYVEDVPAPGADDNGTGVAAVLECARVLGPLELDVGVKFIAFSGEEPGLLGSAYYVDHLAPEDSVIGVINFDMIGYVDEAPLLELIYDWRSRWLSDQLEEVAHTLGLESEVELVNLSGVANSDHASFWKTGIPGNMLIEELKTIGEGKGGPKNPYYHTTGDTSGNLRMSIVGDAARMVVGMMARYAEMPEDSLSDVSLTEGSVEWDWDRRELLKPPLAGDSLTVRVRAVNLGRMMQDPEPYVFEIWQGPRDAGSLIHESNPTLYLLQGEHTELEHGWTTGPETYGDIVFTFALLPVRADVESDLENNLVEVVLEILPETVTLRNLRVTPNPVGYAGGEPRFRFEILHPEGDFNGVMDVWMYDILGTLSGRATLERTPMTRDFGPGDNSVDLSRFVCGRLAPGLYVCKARLKLLGEPGLFERTFKFAVDR